MFQSGVEHKRTINRYLIDDDRNCWARTDGFVEFAFARNEISAVQKRLAVDKREMY